VSILNWSLIEHLRDSHHTKNLAMEHMFFESWDSIIRSFVITILAYIILIFMLRVSGKRTLSKMNAFDFVITIALGSCMATVALNKSVPLADGALVFFLLIMLQYVITWLSVRIDNVKKIITCTPTLLLYKGEMLKEVMKKERVTIEEIDVVARKNGFTDLKEIDAIILETTGDLNVIASMRDDKQTMKDLSNFPGITNKV
jgi:uncharacterized membrane protein YcaP (DUF421 family)